MKYSVRFKVFSDDSYSDHVFFDVHCTRFKVTDDTITICNGLFDMPIFIELVDIISVEFIDSSQAGINYTCYNDIRKALQDYGVTYYE